MNQRALRLLVAAALLAPLASAGTEAGPEVDDSRDMGEPAADLLAAWFTSEPTGVRMTIKVVELPGPIPDRLYHMTFRTNATLHVAALFFDGSGALRSHLDTTPPSVGAPQLFPFGRAPGWGNDRMEDVTFRPGAPAYISGIIPYARIEELEVGVPMTSISAAISGYQQGGWRNLDSRSTSSTFTPAFTIVPSAAREGLFTTLLFLPAIAAGIVLGILIHRRRRAALTRRFERERARIRAAALRPPTPRARHLALIAEDQARMHKWGRLPIGPYTQLQQQAREVAEAPAVKGGRFELAAEGDGPSA